MVNQKHKITKLQKHKQNNVILSDDYSWIIIGCVIEDVCMCCCSVFQWFVHVFNLESQSIKMSNQLEYPLSIEEIMPNSDMFY